VVIEWAVGVSALGYRTGVNLSWQALDVCNVRSSVRPRFWALGIF
jgi:hypothetical protein